MGGYVRGRRSPWGSGAPPLVTVPPIPSGGALASTLAYMGPRPYLFAHLFHDVGEVTVYQK